MSVDELIQLIRTCNLAQVRAQLEKMKEHDPESYQEVIHFYRDASRRKK